VSSQEVDWRSELLEKYIAAHAQYFGGREWKNRVWHEMEPNDQYLCIVPGRGVAESTNGKLFLPFEGDNMLAIILSKAFLLADDKNIKDPTITRQLH
jgi:hypothetical protein